MQLGSQASRSLQVLPGDPLPPPTRVPHAAKLVVVLDPPVSAELFVTPDADVSAEPTGLVQSRALSAATKDGVSGQAHSSKASRPDGAPSEKYDEAAESSRASPFTVTFVQLEDGTYEAELVSMSLPTLRCVFPSVRTSFLSQPMGVYESSLSLSVSIPGDAKPLAYTASVSLVDLAAPSARQLELGGPISSPTVLVDGTTIFDSVSGNGFQ